VLSWKVANDPPSPREFVLVIDPRLERVLCARGRAGSRPTLQKRNRDVMRTSKAVRPGFQGSVIPYIASAFRKASYPDLSTGADCMAVEISEAITCSLAKSIDVLGLDFPISSRVSSIASRSSAACVAWSVVAAAS